MKYLINTDLLSNVVNCHMMESIQMKGIKKLVNSFNRLRRQNLFISLDYMENHCFFTA